MTSSRALKAAEMAALTQARLTLGPRGKALATKEALSFSLDHAKAKEAVLSELDLPKTQSDLASIGLEHLSVTSAAETRATFITRPNLGRVLPPASAEALKAETPSDVVFVLGDGLSAVAVALNGAAFIHALAQRLTRRGLTFGPVVIAQQARVALGDAIAQARQANTVVMVLGERPGLSAADSLGVYITHDPQSGTADSARNCLSNIREAGLDVAHAAEMAERLIVAARAFGSTGVALSQAMEAGQIAPQADS